MNLKFGYSLTPSPIPEIIRQGVLAEECGFKSIWLSDHFVQAEKQLNVCPEVWSMLAVLGMKTKHVMLSSGVTDPVRRHPATTAQIVATLDRILDGRMALGIGAGEAMNLVPYGIEWNEPVRRLREAIECIKSLWTANPDKPANYDGKFYNLKNAFLTVKPKQTPHPPIYIGALGSRTREIVGELADGWFPWITTPELYLEYRKDIEKGAKKAGRSIDEIDAIARFYTVVSDNSDEIRSKIEWSCKKSLVLERHVLKRLGYKVPIPENVRVQRIISGSKEVSSLGELVKQIPMEAAEAISVTGTMEDCIGKIEQYIKAGARHIVINNLGSDETLKKYSGIISYFEDSYRL